MVLFKCCLFELLGEKIMAYLPSTAFSEHQHFNLFDLLVVDNDAGSDQLFFADLIQYPGRSFFLEPVTYTQTFVFMIKNCNDLFF